MSGYRESSFDPGAYAQPGAPLRPYNRVQWLGIALMGLGILLSIVQLFALADGWPWADVVPRSGAFLLLIGGAALLNSRRVPATLVDAEQHRRNRRMLLITTAAVAVILGVAAVLSLQGA